MANALRVLEALSDADRPVAVTELAARLRLPASTTHRILAALTVQGFAARVPAQRRYRTGPALAHLACRSQLEQARLREAARPVLERLAAQSGETSHLAVLAGTDALGIDLVQSSQPVIAHHPVGSLVPAHATAMGQAILAHLPEVAARIARTGLPGFTPGTITDADDFIRGLAEIRERGFAVNVGQLHPETAGVAAPVADASGAVIASLGITGPLRRIGRRRRLEELGLLTLGGAAAIHRRLAELERPPIDEMATRA